MRLDEISKECLSVKPEQISIQTNYFEHAIQL